MSSMPLIAQLEALFIARDRFQDLLQNHVTTVSLEGWHQPSSGGFHLYPHFFILSEVFISSPCVPVS